mmetsp:Transcript_20720/g.36854  ORF Transcript_20720/g.36854 Transcript_20720/m.36854 type:complete len:595 (+) Transcript_20720:87-1871(+)
MCKAYALALHAAVILVALPNLCPLARAAAQPILMLQRHSYIRMLNPLLVSSDNGFHGVVNLTRSSPEILDQIAAASRSAATRSTRITKAHALSWGLDLNLRGDWMLERGYQYVTGNVSSSGKAFGFRSGNASWYHRHFRVFRLVKVLAKIVLQASVFVSLFISLEFSQIFQNAASCNKRQQQSLLPVTVTATHTNAENNNSDADDNALRNSLGGNNTVDIGAKNSQRNRDLDLSIDIPHEIPPLPAEFYVNLRENKHVWNFPRKSESKAGNVDGGFVGVKGGTRDTCVRDTDTCVSNGLVKNGRKKVLFLGAFSSPSHAIMADGKEVAVEGLRLMSEIREFQKLFSDRETVMLPAASWSDVVSSLNRLTPEILHLSGHCINDSWVFEGEDRAVSCIGGAAIGRMLAAECSETLRCVVLSGCKSDVIARKIKEKVGKNVRVVCATTKLNNTFAAKFCSSFYKKLLGAEGESPFDSKASKASCSDNVCLSAFSQASFQFQSKRTAAAAYSVQKQKQNQFQNNQSSGANPDEANSREIGMFLGDPSFVQHALDAKGNPILDFDHEGNPHPSGPDGVAAFSPLCYKCVPRAGGVFKML